MMSAACKARMHNWGPEGGRPGAVCVNCDHHYGQSKATVRPRKLEPEELQQLRSEFFPGVPQKEQAPEGSASPPDELASRRARNPALAQRWQQLAPGGSASPSVEPAPPAEASSASGAGPALSHVEAEHLAELLRPYVADGLISVEEWIIERRGYIPKPCDGQQREELHACVEVLLRRLLPDVAVGPWSKAGFTLAMIYLSMRVGAEKKPAPLVDGARATAPIPAAKPPSPPPSFPPTPSGPDVLGSAGSAVQSA